MGTGEPEGTVRAGELDPWRWGGAAEAVWGSPGPGRELGEKSYPQQP